MIRTSVFAFRGSAADKTMVIRQVQQGVELPGRDQKGVVGWRRPLPSGKWTYRKSGSTKYANNFNCKKKSKMATLVWVEKSPKYTPSYRSRFNTSYYVLFPPKISNGTQGAKQNKNKSTRGQYFEEETFVFITEPFKLRNVGAFPRWLRLRAVLPRILQSTPGGGEIAGTMFGTTVLRKKSKDSKILLSEKIY